ncbi:hypothetical protein UA08_07532 [Talaromyces atroroseus]|uniref:T6SS Phospholipase effector Tle1-like catalytic domain-containing protein n=1 Tax=Talaromyces atroroseus TaxID=1441469 RepID=A0A225AAZ2_TALAT|nr:hypothetical protein UA08_07532 [Talaromyces atroroseus]OKL57390.1 hypothetical protein UA08_07532 [Talaromyces atroroseus]
MAQQRAKQAGYKRIILCADGTWLSSDLGDKSVPTNVAKIARAIATSGPDRQGAIVPQIVYYHSGLGSGDLPLQKAIYGGCHGFLKLAIPTGCGVGWGLDIDICQLYEFISNNYAPGDELMLFGFSRGAFTARSVAGLVGDIGILSPVNMSHFADMWKAYTANTDGEPFSKSAWYQKHKDKLHLSENIKIKVVGVWDTVGALGIPEWPLVGLAARSGIAFNKKYSFHNTRLSKNVDYAFQCLAIDERRLTFPPALWHKTAGAPAKDMKQCWFPGIHGNIGGQADDPTSPANDHGEIGDITFAWMVDNLSGMLTFEEEAIKNFIEQHHDSQADNKPKGSINEWGCGPIVSNFAGLQGAFFRLLGKQDRTPGAYPRDAGDGVEGATNEYLHPIVRFRKLKVNNYNPASLAGFRLEEPDGGTGWKWAKKGVQALPEYVLRPEKTISLAFEGGYKSGSSLSRLLCPKALLQDLDRDNGLLGARAATVPDST